MITNSKSLRAIILLFLNFFVISRYFQLIKFDRDLSNTFLHRLSNKRNACEPLTDSILGQYQKNNKRVLFIMLDSYPEESLYKKLVEKESKLHNYLKDNSSEYIETSTQVPYTYKSLPYLLGKVDVREKCRFPFLSGYLKPNLILGSSWMSTNESICKFQIKQENFFVRISQVIQKTISEQQRSKWWRITNNCYLSSKDSPINIQKKMENERFNKRNISFIAESKFHDVIDPNLINKPADLKLIPYYDELYYDSIKKIISKTFEHNLVDEIIVMNDHGPRTQIFGEIIKNETASQEQIDNIKKNLELNSFFDKDYYGIFLAKFDSTKHEDNLDKYSKNSFLKTYLPKNKKRFFISSRGEAIFLKEF